MPLVLELPAEIEAKLRRAATLAGRDLEEWIVEAARKEAMQMDAVSLEDAARMLAVSRAFLLKNVDNGKLSGLKRGGEWLIFVDERFEMLRQEQRATRDALFQIERINSALGLYD